MTRTLAITLAVVVGLALTTSPALSKRGRKGRAAKDSARPAAAETAPAAPEAEPPGEHAPLVKYRHTLLEGVAKHFGMSRAILMGKVDRPDDLAAHARAIHDASTDFVSMFPEGSGPDAYPKTDALASIWTDWAGFEAKAKAFETESKAFLELAEAGDLEGAKAQMQALGKACGSCHDAHRKDED